MSEHANEQDRLQSILSNLNFQHEQDRVAEEARGMIDRSAVGRERLENVALQYAQLRVDIGTTLTLLQSSGVSIDTRVRRPLNYSDGSNRRRRFYESVGGFEIASRTFTSYWGTDNCHSSSYQVTDILGTDGSFYDFSPERVSGAKFHLVLDTNNFDPTAQRPATSTSIEERMTQLTGNLAQLLFRHAITLER